MWEAARDVVCAIHVSYKVCQQRRSPELRLAALDADAAAIEDGWIKDHSLNRVPRREDIGVVSKPGQVQLRAELPRVHLVVVLQSRRVQQQT